MKNDAYKTYDAADDRDDGDQNGEAEIQLDEIAIGRFGSLAGIGEQVLKLIGNDRAHDHQAADDSHPFV